MFCSDLLLLTSAAKLFQLQKHRQSALELAVEVRFVAIQLLQTVRLQSFTQCLRLDCRLITCFPFHAHTNWFQMFADELRQPFGGRWVFLVLDIPIPPVAGFW